MRALAILGLLLSGLPRAFAAAAVPEFNQDFSCQHPATVFLLEQLLLRAESRWERVEKAVSSCPISEVRLLVQPDTRRDDDATFIGATIHRPSGAGYLVHFDAIARGQWTVERIPMAKVDAYVRVLGKEVADLKRSPLPDRTPEEIEHLDRILQSLRDASRGKGHPELSEMMKGYPKALGKKQPERHTLPAGIVPVWDEFTPATLVTLSSESPEGAPFRPGAPLLPHIRGRMGGTPDMGLFGWAKAEPEALVASWQYSVHGGVRTYQLSVHDTLTGLALKQFDKLVIDTAGSGDGSTPGAQAREVLQSIDAYLTNAGLRVGALVRPSGAGEVAVEPLGVKLGIDAKRGALTLKRRGDKAGKVVLDLKAGLGTTCAAGGKLLPVRIESASYLVGIDSVAVRLKQACDSDTDANADQDWQTRVISTR